MSRPTDPALIAHMQQLRVEGLSNRDIADLVGNSRDSVAGLLRRYERPTTVRPPSPDELEWQLDALCAQVDPDAMFPEKGGSSKTAKQVCARCPVRAECLAFGLEDRFGIYGGLSERERRSLVRTGWKYGDPLPKIRPDNRGQVAA